MVRSTVRTVSCNSRNGIREVAALSPQKQVVTWLTRKEGIEGYEAFFQSRTVVTTNGCVRDHAMNIVLREELSTVIKYDLSSLSLLLRIICHWAVLQGLLFRPVILLKCEASCVKYPCIREHSKRSN